MNKGALACMFVGVGVALGVLLANIVPPPESKQAIEWLENPRSFGDFHLMSTGEKLDKGSLLGKWTIVVFGFLNCPDVCPTSLSKMASLSDGVREQSLDEQINLVFVSVDPDRDSIEDINRYVHQFDMAILGVTGEQNQLTRFAEGLGIQFQVSSDGQNVAHSVTFSIVDPKGRLSGRFRPNANVPELLGSLGSKIGI